MSDDPRLKLNTLDRYRKRSPDLVLQDYSHCEVPAGCGGVVLRWIDPREAIPLLFYVFSPGQCSPWIDGVQVTSAAPLLHVGAHVFAARIEGAPLGEGAIMAAGVCRLAGPDVRVVIRTDEHTRWRATTFTPPGDAWTLPEFDDSAWGRMVTQPMMVPASKDRASWAYEQTRRHDPRPLGLPGASGTVWVRARFVLEPGGVVR